MYGFNGMNDEEFRKEFIRFLNTYQSGLENFMKKNYGTNRGIDFFSMGMEPFDNDFFKKIINNISEDLNVEKGRDDNGEWEKRTWSSPDGTTNYSSFSRNSYFNPFDGKVEFKKEGEEIDTIKLLNKKLNQAIMREKYEDAAKIRDLINSLKEDNKD